MSAFARSAEGSIGGSLRLRIAVVRAILDEVERSLNDLDESLGSSVGPQLAKELRHLALRFQQQRSDEDSTVEASGSDAVPETRVVTPISSPSLLAGSYSLPPPPRSGAIALSLETAFQAAARARGGSECQELRFDCFRVDLREERIWKEGKELRLRRKEYSILRYLAQRPRQLVTQSEVIEAVWGKVALSESLLRTHIRDLRRVLGYALIETVMGRGYRFLADVEASYSRHLPGIDVEQRAARMSS